MATVAKTEENLFQIYLEILKTELACKMIEPYAHCSV